MQYLLLGTEQSLSWLSTKYGVHAASQVSGFLFFNVILSHVTAIFTLQWLTDLPLRTLPHMHTLKRKSSNFPPESTPTPFRLYILLWKAILQPWYPSILCPLKYTQKIIKKSTRYLLLDRTPGWMARKEPRIPSLSPPFPYLSPRPSLPEDIGFFGPQRIHHSEENSSSKLKF